MSASGMGFGHGGTLKFKPRKGIYEASNVSLDPKSLDAHSYNWWRFCARIKGKVVFNDYPYSVSTRRHQHKVLNTLEAIGIKPEVFVSVRSSLNLDSLNEGALNAQIALDRANGKRIRARSPEMKAFWARQVSEQALRIAKLLKLIGDAK